MESCDIFAPKICFQLTGAQFVLLDSKEILSVEADGQVCYISLLDGNRLTVARHLGYYKNSLMQRYRFVEVSKSVLVNAHHIYRYSHREQLLTLTTGKTFSPSKSKSIALNQLFQKYHLSQITTTETDSQEA
ncbi:MAG: LytTR family transcriptional regulator DNA-binding domain-containing protein [Saprospiraceae bacterium]